MQKALWIVAAMAATPLAMAHNSQGPGCGLGHQIFEGQTGLFAHTAAATTNGVGTQLFGLTSGTSNCNGEQVVSAEQQKSIFVASNFDTLAREAAMGQGKHLAALAEMTGVQAADREAFNALIQQRYDALFSDDSEAMLTALSASLAQHPTLAKYA